MYPFCAQNRTPSFPFESAVCDFLPDVLAAMLNNTRRTACDLTDVLQAPFGKMTGQKVPEAYQWKPSDVLQYMRDKRRVRVGLVVDLTMSSRYYDPEEFRQHRAIYLKIKCKGHGEVPSPEDVNRFVWEVWNYRNALHTEWEQVGFHVIGRSRVIISRLPTNRVPSSN
jgi:hypothetical protein